MAYNIKGDLGVLRRVFSRFIRVESLSGNTGNVLSADNNGEIVSRNVDFFLTGSTIFNNKVNNSTFYPYTSATNTLIGTKLDKSAFTGFTDSFYAYTSATNTLIGTKLDTSIFANYTANTGSNVSAEFTAFTQTFYQYTADTNNLINTKLDKTTFTAFTNSFNSYSANTLNTINNNYNQFTAFTNSFYSYSSNTQNTINNNYSQFTGFTNSFNSYSANTLNLINTKYDKSGGTISGSVTILGNLIVNGTATTINTQNLLVYDPIIGLALVQSGSTNPTLDSGFIIERGLSGNTGLIWIETNKQFELGYTNNTYNDLNVNISNYGNLKLGGLKTNYIYDSLGITGLTNYLLSTTPSGIKWISATTIDVTGKLDTSTFTSFTNSFYSYTSATQTAINSKLNLSDFNTFTGTTLPANYFKQGGNSFGTSALLGSNDGQSLGFKTNNTTRMTISSGGTIGINVPPTTARLELYQSGGTAVNIAGSVGNLLTVTDTNTGSLLQVLNNSGNTIFEVGSNNNVGITGTTRFVGNIFDFTNSSGNTGNLLTTRQGGVYWSSFDSLLSGSTIYTAFTNSFYSYTSNTQNTINNNYGQFTAFTNSFNSYSANTKNIINNNYSQFTAFTNTFYVYSAQTDSRLLFSSGTIGSTFRIGNNNDATNSYSTVSGGKFNTSSGIVSTVGGGCYNTALGDISFIGGGRCNTLSGQYSVIGGGQNNTSSGCCSFIGGGQNNTSLGDYSVIVGGSTNDIESCDSSIGGGMGNLIVNGYSTIAGGLMNVIGQSSTFSGYWNNSFIAINNDVSSCFSVGDNLRVYNPSDNKVYSSTVSNIYYNPGTTCTEVSLNTSIGIPGTFPLYNKTTSSVLGDYNFIGGGRANLALGARSVVTGGNRNTACNDHSTISGGYRNTTSGNYSTISGGYCNTASGDKSFIGGGCNNITCSQFTSIAGGKYNTVSGAYSIIAGGQNNTSSGYTSAIAGGNGNVASGQNSFIGGGYGNTATNNATTVSGGISNTVSGYRSAALGGMSNTVSGCYSINGAGKNNIVSGCFSGVLGGCNNTALGNNTFIFGSNITGSLNNTTYVENLNIRNNIYDSFGTTGTTGYLLSTTPNGVKWVSGATSTSLTPNFDYIDFTTGYTATSKTARVYFDTTEKALSYFPDQSQNVVVRIGQQLYTRVNNVTGSDIPKGSVITLQSASNGLPNATLALAQHDTRSQVAGLAADRIPNGGVGLVLNNGLLTGLSANTYNVGDILYLSDTTPGAYVAGTSSFSLAKRGRTNEIGYVVATGTTDGKIYVNINNEDENLSLTDIERNILEGNAISTGIFTYTGMTKTSNTTFQVSPAFGWIVQNTYNYSLQPDVVLVSYSGSTTGQTTPYLTTSDATFVLLTTASTLSFQTTFPTAQQRRENIFLGKVVHPNRSSILNVNNTVDFDVSPMAALRDLWTPIKLVNQGILVTPNGANLNINTSTGALWGNGIGWVTNQQNPNSVSIPSKAPATFAYRTQTGGTTGEVSTIDVGNYDVNGVVTPVPGTQYTTQRIYQFPTGLIRIQYGQTSYTTLAKALAGLTTESFVEFSNTRDNAILIGLLTVVSTATDLSNTSQAVFTLVSKFGEVLTGTAGGLSTTTLQQAYDNSVQPEILTNSTLGAVTFRRGSTSDNDNVIEVQNNSGINTFAVTGQGNLSGNSFNVKTYIYDSLNTSGITNQVLFTTPSGVRWNNIDSIVTGYTSSKLNITDFSSYSANTLNTINNNYSQFTGFTNSFNSYSANTLNRINTDYWLFTAFTNSFNSYSANTLTSINNKVIELGSGIGSTIRINNCNTTTGIYSSILGGLSGTTTGNYSSILGGLLNNITGVNSSILGGSGNTISSNNSTIGGGRNNTTAFNNTFIFGSSIVANAVDTTYTQCINACGQTLLQGTSASSGCALLVRNSTPLALYTALNTGQHLFNGTFTSTANATCGWNLNQTLTQRGTGCDTLYATYINPTIIYAQNNQTNKALSVQASFTGTTLTWTGATNIIADFGATNVGTQLSITDVISGTIYGVNDVSGLPIIDATSNWDVNMYDFPNKVFTKTGKSLILGVSGNSASTTTIQSDLIFNEGIGLGYRMSQVTGVTTGSSVSVLYQLTIPTGQTVFLITNTLGRANNANMDSTLGEIKFTAKRSLTGSLTQVGVAQGFVNRDNNNTNIGIDISSNNIRLVVTGNTDTYLWASNIITQTY